MIHILCCSSNEFCQPCSVLLASLFHNNPTEQFQVYLLTTGLNEQNIKNVEQLSRTFKQSIEIITITDDILYTLPVIYKEIHSIACYLRLFSQKMIPESVDKILYFDSDIIVRSSIKELWDTDVEEHALAAVAGILPYTEHRERLGYPSEYMYFNTGVMLVNLAYWRQNKILEQLLSYISSHRERIRLCEQDAINAILYDKIKRISGKWNIRLAYFNTPNVILKDDRTEIYKYINTPPIFHFSSGIKPWHKDYPNSSMKKEYIKYLNLTPYKNVVFGTFFLSTKAKCKYYIRYYINEMLVKLYSLRFSL